MPLRNRQERKGNFFSGFLESGRLRPDRSRKTMPIAPTDAPRSFFWSQNRLRNMFGHLGRNLAPGEGDSNPGPLGTKSRVLDHSAPGGHSPGELSPWGIIPLGNHPPGESFPWGIIPLGNHSPGESLPWGITPWGSLVTLAVAAMNMEMAMAICVATCPSGYPQTPSKRIPRGT